MKNSMSVEIRKDFLERLSPGDVRGSVAATPLILRSRILAMVVSHFFPCIRTALWIPVGAAATFTFQPSHGHTP